MLILMSIVGSIVKESIVMEASARAEITKNFSQQPDERLKRLAKKHAWLHNHDSCDLKCGIVPARISQEKSDGANKLSRARKLRHAMAAPAEVRISMISMEICRSKCSKMRELISPTTLLIDTHISNSNNHGRADQQLNVPGDIIANTIAMGHGVVEDRQNTTTKAMTDPSATGEVHGQNTSIEQLQHEAMTQFENSMAEAASAMHGWSDNMEATSTKSGEAEAVFAKPQSRSQIEVGIKAASKMAGDMTSSTAIMSNEQPQHGTKRGDGAEGTTAPTKRSDRPQPQLREQLEFDSQQYDSNVTTMTPAELKIFWRLQSKFNACNVAKKLYEGPTKRTPLDPARLTAKMINELQWPSDLQHGSHEEKAYDLMQQWQILIKDHVVDGTGHMRAAIMTVIGKLQPKQLQHMVIEAADTGKLRGGNAKKREHWAGRALWYSDAAVHLVTDAAETYDRLLVSKNQQRSHERSPHMNVVKETRYHSEHNGQVHATTTAFEPTPGGISDDDIFDMDHESDDDAFPAQVLLDMVNSMVTSKRERTITWLKDIAAAGSVNNPVLGLLRNIPQRQKVVQTKALTKTELKRQRMIDTVFQKDVVRKVRKWNRAVRTAEQNREEDNNKPQNHSPGRTSINTLDEAATFNQNKPVGQRSTNDVAHVGVRDGHSKNNGLPLTHRPNAIQSKAQSRERTNPNMPPSSQTNNSRCRGRHSATGTTLGTAAGNGEFNTPNPAHVSGRGDHPKNDDPPLTRAPNAMEVNSHAGNRTGHDAVQTDPLRNGDGSGGEGRIAQYPRHPNLFNNGGGRGTCLTDAHGPAKSNAANAYANAQTTGTMCPPSSYGFTLPNSHVRDQCNVKMDTVNSREQNAAHATAGTGFTRHMPIMQGPQAPTPSEQPPNLNEQTQQPQQSGNTPWLHMSNTGASEPGWVVWRHLTPLQRQQHRERRMMGHANVTTPATMAAGMSMDQQNVNIGIMLQQLSTNQDKPPECTMLRSTGSEERARWQNDLDDYDYRVWQYRQSHPWYVPTLSKWVVPAVWRDISEDLLHPDDQTDGGPPNDIATESFLRQEGRYEAMNGERGKVQHPNTLKELQNIKWVARTHT